MSRPCPCARRCNSAITSRPCSIVSSVRKLKSTSRAENSSPAARVARVDQHRVRLLERLGMRLASADAKIFAVEIERLFVRPEPLDDAEPLGAEAIAHVVFTLRRAE